jgi:hypothetical protein
MLSRGGGSGGGGGACDNGSQHSEAGGMGSPNDGTGALVQAARGAGKRGSRYGRGLLRNTYGKALGV